MDYSFTIPANPGTDIWRKPPKTDVFNAPISNATSNPLSSFKSARVSFLAKWTEQYDQAGLLLSLRPPSAGAEEGSDPPPKWIKMGLEFYDSVPRIGIVACDAWADWSVAPVQGRPDEMITILAERANSDGFGNSIWIYQVVGGEKHPLREVTWVFASPEMDGWELSIGAFAARPERKTEGTLEVKFREMEVVWG